MIGYSTFITRKYHGFCAWTREKTQVTSNSARLTLKVQQPNRHHRLQETKIESKGYRCILGTYSGTDQMKKIERMRILGHHSGQRNVNEVRLYETTLKFVLG